MQIAPDVFTTGRTAVPLHDLGYRRWDGELNSQSVRWWVIAQTGIRLAWRSRWLRRMLVLAWVPAIAAGIGFFFVENAISRSMDVSLVLRGLSNVFPGAGAVADSLETQNVGTNRETLWPLILLTFFRLPQGFLIVMLTALVAPSLIAQDMRSRAFLLYFSRPITRLEYVAGKMATVGAYLAMITLVPGIVLYLLGVGLSPDLSVVADTWDLPFRVVVSSIVVIIPTATFSQSLSALMGESRFATFCWFAPWSLGFAAFGAMTAMTEASSMSPTDNPLLFRNTWTILSPYHVLGEVESWIFGMRKNFDDVAPEAMVLSVVTLVSTGILLRKVSSPMRV